MSQGPMTLSARLRANDRGENCRQVSPADFAAHSDGPSRVCSRRVHPVPSMDEVALSRADLEALEAASNKPYR
jgi:hypothetical protein